MLPLPRCVSGRHCKLENLEPNVQKGLLLSSAVRVEKLMAELF